MFLPTAVTNERLFVCLVGVLLQLRKASQTGEICEIIIVILHCRMLITESFFNIGLLYCTKHFYSKWLIFCRSGYILTPHHMRIHHVLLITPEVLGKLPKYHTGFSKKVNCIVFLLFSVGEL